MVYVAQGEARSLMTSSDAETDSKPVIIIIIDTPGNDLKAKLSIQCHSKWSNFPDPYYLIMRPITIPIDLLDLHRRTSTQLK